MNYLATNLRFLRVRYNVSNREIAEILGYKSPAAITKWEASISEPPLSVLMQLSSYYHVSLDELVSINLSAFYDIRSENLENSPDEHIKVAKELMDELKSDTSKKMDPVAKLRRMRYLQMYAGMICDPLKPYLLIEMAQIATEIIRKITETPSPSVIEEKY